MIQVPLLMAIIFMSNAITAGTYIAVELPASVGQLVEILQKAIAQDFNEEQEHKQLGYRFKSAQFKSLLPLICISHDTLSISELDKKYVGFGTVLKQIAAQSPIIGIQAGLRMLDLYCRYSDQIKKDHAHIILQFNDNSVFAGLTNYIATCLHEHCGLEQQPNVNAYVIIGTVCKDNGQAPDQIIEHAPLRLSSKAINTIMPAFEKIIESSPLSSITSYKLLSDDCCQEEFWFGGNKD